MLKKVSADYDANDRLGAMNFLGHHAAKGQVVTGLIFVDSEPEDLHRHFNTVDKPLNSLSEKELCPGSAALEKINAACGSAAANPASLNRSRAPSSRWRNRAHRPAAACRAGRHCGPGAGNQ